jgi:type I restriction enzyme S subunit
VEDGNHGEYRPRREEFVRAGTSFIRAADLAGGRVDFAGAERINDIALARIRKGVGAPGDVLLSHKGTVGRVALVPLDAPPFVCSPQTTFWRSLNLDEIDRGYLRFFLESPDFVEQLRSRKGETDMADYVSLTEQRRLEVVLPPIEEQRAIAEVLGALDDKIESNHRLASLLQELAALHLAMFPSEKRALRDVAHVTMGSSPPGDTYNEDGDGLPFYQGVRDFGFRLPARRVFCSVPKRTAEQGDTLISVRAPVGRLNRARERCCIGRGVAAARSQQPSTLYYVLRATESAWEPFHGEGTVFGAINRDSLQSVLVDWPTDADGCEAELGELDERLTTAVLEIETLSALRGVLLPEVMSGGGALRPRN